MKILLATDNSDASKAAASFLSTLPLRDPVDLVAVHAVTEGNAPAHVGLHPAWARVVESLVADGQRDTDEVAALVVNAASVQTVIKKGSPADIAVQRAEEVGADLILVGAVGHSAIRRMMLGSVSDQIATHAHVPTLVHRAAAERPAGALRVLVGYDGSDRAKEAIQRVTQFFRPDGVEIKLVAVVPEIGTIAIEYAEAAQVAWEDAHSELEKLLSEEAAVLSADAFGVTWEVRSAAHVADEICQIAKESNTDIVVVGDQGHGAVKRFFLGSVSRYVLRHADCTVWLDRN